MTINTLHGQTFRQVGVWLPSPMFSHGQLYVALSRVGDPLGLSIGAQLTTMMDRLVEGVANIVWNEILD